MHILLLTVSHRTHYWLPGASELLLTVAHRWCCGQHYGAPVEPEDQGGSRCRHHQRRHGSRNGAYDSRLVNPAVDVDAFDLVVTGYNYMEYFHGLGSLSRPGQ